MATHDLESTRPVQPSPADREQLDPVALRAALDDATWAGLIPASLGLGILLLLSALVLLVFPDGSDAVAPLVIHLVGATALLVCALVVRAGRVARRTAPGIAAGVILVAAATSLCQISLTQNIHQTANLLIIVVGAAVLILSQWWLALAWAAIWGAWLVIVLRLPPGDFDPTQFVFAMTLATVAGFLIYHWRVSYVTRSEQARRTLRRSEEELHAKSSRLAALIDALDVGVLMEDEHRRVVQTNRAMCDIFGLSQSPDELVGVDLAERAGRFIQATFLDGARLRAENAELGRQRVPVAHQEVRFVDGRVFEQDYAPLLVDDLFRGQLWLYRDITARNRAETELNWWASKLRILHHISLRVSSDIDSAALRESIVRGGADLLDARMGGLYLVEPDGQSLRVVAATPPFDVHVGVVLRMGEGAAGRAAQTGAPVAIADYQAWQGQAGVYAQSSFRRVLAVPLQARGQTLGALIITDDEKTGAFNDDEIRLVSLYADQAAIAIENAHLLDELQAELAGRTRVEEALRHRAAFEEVVTSLSTRFIDLAPSEADVAVEQSLALIGRFVDVDRVCVFQFAPGRSRISNTHEWCAPNVAPQLAALQDVSVDAFPQWLERLQRSETIHLPRVTEPSPVSLASGIHREPGGTMVVVPLIVGRELAGFIGFDWIRASKDWAEEDLALLRVVGELIGLALHRKRTDEALREGEQVYRSLFDHTNDAVFIIDLDGHHLEVNQRACDLLGYARDEMLALSVHDVVVQAEYESSEAVMQSLRNGEEIEVYERTFRRKDGSAIKVEVDAALIRDAQGAPMHYQSVARDITQRKQAEAALRRSEARYRLLADISPALSASLDTRGLFNLVLEQTARVMYAENMIIALYDASSHAVELVLCANPEDGAPGLRIPVDEGLAGYIIRNGRSVLLHGDVMSEARRMVGVDVVGRPAASWLGVPMQLGASSRDGAGPRIVGMIAVQHFTDPGMYDESDAALLQTIANQAAIALENGRLLDQLQQELTERGRVEEALRYRAGFEEVVTELSTRLIALVPIDVDRAIRHGLGAIGSFVDVDRAYVFLFNASGSFMDNTHEWCADGIEPQIDLLQDIPSETLPWWMAKLKRSETVYIPQVSQLPPEAGAERRFLEPQGIQSLVAVPMTLGGGLVGFLGLESVRSPRAWPDDDIALLRTVGEIIANALARRSAEEALRESEHRYRLISENSEDVIWLLDVASEEFTYVSPSVSRLLGYTPEEILDQPLRAAMTRESYERFLDSLPARLEAFANGDESARAGIHQLDQYRKDHTVVPTEVVTTLLNEFGSRDVQILGVSRDITDRKRAEEELSRANVALAEARDEALQASRLKSEFLATMSHELRTPLNAIIGMTGLLLDTELSDRQRDYAETCRRSSETLLSLINDILDFSKIEAGKLELEEQPFSPAECLENAVDLVRVRAAEKRLELSYEIAPGTPHTLVGDATRLQQMLVNLLSNAVKFTERGRVAITVSASPRAGGQVELLLAVADTGIGMTRDQVAHLFVPFAQGDASTSRRYGGTGLGLSITQRLAKMMGGRVSVETEPDRGSTFYLTVLLNVADESEARERTGTALGDKGRPQPQADLGQRHPLRILLAEDSPVNQKVALYLLERMGYRADVAANGREALEAVVRQQYDVVLMDVQMPEMDGVEAAARIRDRFPAGQRPYIVAMTAHALRGDRERFLDAGMDEYIAKPVRAQELANALARCVPVDGDAHDGDQFEPLLAPSDKGPASELRAELQLPRELAAELEPPVELDPPLDPAAVADLQELFACGPDEAIAEVGAILLEYAPPLLTLLHEAVGRLDGSELARNAHALKSSSASAAALRLSALSAEIERAGRSGNLAGAEEKLVELEAEFARVRRAIETALAERDA